jgi:hypothetical protein
MAVRLSALRAGRFLPSRTFLVLTSVRGWVDPRVVVQLEGLGQLENEMTSSRIEPATFRHVAWALPILLNFLFICLLIFFLSFRTILCFINPDYRLILMTSPPKLIWINEGFIVYGLISFRTPVTSCNSYENVLAKCRCTVSIIRCLTAPLRCPNLQDRKKRKETRRAYTCLCPIFCCCNFLFTRGVWLRKYEPFMGHVNGKVIVLSCF